MQWYSYRILTSIMRRIMSLIALMSLGCSQEQVFTSIDDDLRPYVQEFYSHLPHPEIVSITVKFGVIDDGGQCIKTNTSQHVTVIVNQDQWPAWCDEQKRAVVFHELAHCVLGREHTEQAAISYLAPQIKSCAFYTENKDALIEEMFTF